MQWAAAFVYAATDFCGVCSSDAQCFSVGRPIPKNCPFTLGALDPHRIHGSLVPPESPPNGISRLDQFIRVFTAHECDQQTHTGRDHATPSVAIDRIYAMHAMRPKNKERNIAVANTVHPDHCCEICHLGKFWSYFDRYIDCCGIKIKFCMEVVFRSGSVVSKC